MAKILKALAAVSMLTAFSAQASKWSDHVLCANDCGYYMITGKGETFANKRVSLTTDPAKRKAFWDGVAAEKIPVIWQLHFPKGAKWGYLPELPVAIKAVDEFFAAGDDVSPCPEKLFAVTLKEENVVWDGQFEIQDAVARYIHEKYGVKVYQWFTEPLKPRLGLYADGWMFDAYSITDPAAFYAHIESFVLTGKPVVVVPWGAGNYAGYHKQKTWDELVRFTIERFDMIRSFDLPLMVFSVAGKGSPANWFKAAKTSGERYYRETIQHYMKAVPEMPKASYKAPAKTWRIRTQEDGTASGRIDLKSFWLVRETMFTGGVKNWTLTDDGLRNVTNNASLSWRVVSTGRDISGVFILRHSRNAKGTFCGRPLSADGITRVDAAAFCERALTLESDGPVVLESLAFEGHGTYVEEELELEMDTSYGRTDYTRHIVFEGDSAKLGGKAGSVAKKRVVRKIRLPGHEVGRLLVDADVVADKKNYAAAVTMSVSIDGETPLVSATTDPNGPVRQKLELVKDPPDTKWTVAGYHLPPGTEIVYLVFDLKVACGTETADGACVKSCDFRFRPWHP